MHLQKLVNAQEPTKSFEPEFIHNVTSMSQEENGAKMAREKLSILRDGTEDKKSVQIREQVPLQIAPLWSL